jgi:hypothetical protein
VALSRPARIPAKFTVVPDIPIIHSRITENFTSATRGRGAWCSSDRGGRPSLSGKPATARRVRKGQRTDLRRQAIGESPRVLFGASREEAPEEVIASCATRLPGSFRTWRASGTREWLPQEGPRNIGRLWPGTGSGIQVARPGLRNWVPQDRPDSERQANLREAQSSRGPAPLRRERYGGKRRLSW